MGFKTFLVEGGNATKRWNTARAAKADISEALQFVANALDVSTEYLETALLGSARTALMNLKSSAGDIDIAIPVSEFDPRQVHAKMIAAVNGEGTFNRGIGVGSYAVPVSTDKKVQVDLMFAPHREWALWMYHSAEGERSRYPGIVRNVLMAAIVSESLPKLMSTRDFQVFSDGKNIRVFDAGSGNEIVRAAISLKPSTGLERLFKVAPVSSKTGARAKTMQPAMPKEVRQALTELGIENLEFDAKAFHLTDPERVARFIFGKAAKAQDFLTAESVLRWCYENLTDQQRQRVFDKARELLNRAGVKRDRRPSELA